ncbi:hypothetical protein ACFWA6_13950 [Streptomyces sp. NPDC060020]|uniref:hypothetical protein n=1 Tax=Streptomyces sp. NPDC060020 TaxID=3347038 RepID=UPI00369B9248
MSEKQGTHFWFMVILVPGGSLMTVRATITPQRGRTRLDLFDQIREEVASLHPETRDGQVVAFDIQPNKL